MITSAEIQQYQSNTFDNQFTAIHKSRKIAWYPWVGKQYLSASYKILVILESHYINKERTNITDIALPNFTRRIVAEQIFPQHYWKSDTFPPLTECLSGQKLPVEKRHLLWEKVAFYNFIQRPMDNPKARPNKQDFVNGWKTFPAVVDILRPDVCIFADFAIISKMSLPMGLQVTRIEWEKDSINGAYPRSCFTIKTQNHTMKGVAVKHPGRSFTANKWRAVLQRQVPNAIKILSL